MDAMGAAGVLDPSDQPVHLPPMNRTATAVLLALVAMACAAGDAGGDTPTSDTPPSGGTQPPPPASGAQARECASPGTGWIWCDDFETDRLASYFEVNAAGGAFVRTNGVGQGDSYGMRATYRPGVSETGNLKLAFGVSPDPGYVRPVDGGTQKYREIYWRLFTRTQSGWNGGGPNKLSRAMVLASRSWQQAAIGHVWSPSGGAPFLMIDPARGTDANGALKTTQYNDVANFTWLGAVSGTSQVFSAANANVWFCVEAHMKLNDAGQSNGLLEFWVNGNLEGRQTGLNFLGSYSTYGINAVFFENYWNDASPVTQSRFFDNIVVSTEKIGCTGRV
jgi:hypothetical protein